MADFGIVIGLEVHVELATKTKVFCGCPTKFGSAPNSQVCPVCLGHPGVLPVLNREALDHALTVGLALDCAIAPRFKFDRKHYYYPDLPKNYQISQYDIPLASDGKVTLKNGKTIRIRRVHLEEDAGKLVHEGAGEKIGAATGALVDYNRAGMPLLEIVTEPDVDDPGDAVEYLRSIQTLVRYLRVSDGNMEEGSMRCEVNVSLSTGGEWGTKVEVKNLNSFRAVEQSLAHEISRQREAKTAGRPVVQETRLYDEESGETRPMRSKESAHDYRYFPEPDLLPFTVSEERKEALRRRIPEMPAGRRKRYAEQLGLPDYDAEVLTAQREVADYFEAAVAAGAPPKAASNWIMTELLGALNAAGMGISESRVTAANLAALIGLIENSTISGKIAKSVFASMFSTGKDAGEIVKDQGLVQITDEGALAEAIAQVIGNNPQSVADYRSGRKQAVGFLVGQVMKATSGKANPQKVNQLLKEALEKS